MAAIRWLHLTDLHCGLKGDRWLWPRVKQRFFDDLAAVTELAGGPIDVVFFTGDLTNRGERGEFAQLDVVLREIWARLAELGATDVPLLPVPGNHDLVRPKPDDKHVRSALRELKQWDEDEVLRADFLDGAGNHARAMIDDAFAPYREWLETCPFVPKGRTIGALPGDFSCTVTSRDGGVRLGVIGLNSTFLQVTDGVVAGTLALEAEQFQRACGGDAIDWAGRHHGVLLLTHQPLSWLSQRAAAVYRQEIYADDHLIAHLCGHLHEHAEESTRSGGGVTRRTHQTASLFGMETRGEGQEVERIHGYAVGRLDVEGTSGRLRRWPRRTTRLQDGTFDLIADPTAKIDKKDQGTAAEIVVLRSIDPAAIATAGAAAAASAKTRDLAPYLAYLEKSFATLEMPIATGDGQKSLPLERIYVKLRLAPRGARRGESIDKAAAGRGDVELRNVLPGSKLLAVIGDPGAGKTTLLKFIALVLARDLLGLPGEGARGPLGLDEPAPPLFLRLTHVADRWLDDGPRDPGVHRWPEVIAAELRARSAVTLSNETVERMLQDGGLLVLFDGLDEVAGEDARKRIAAGIAEFARAFAGRTEHPNRFIVTCRTRAWGAGEQFAAFDEVEIQPLDDAAIQEFIERWSTAAESTAVDAERLARGMEAAIREAREVRRIATNPHMLTMLALLYHGQKRLPEQRAILYERCVELLVERRKEHLAAWGKPPAIVRHLQALARAMHDARDADDRPKHALGHDDAVRLLAGRVNGKDDDAKKDGATELLNALEIYVNLVRADGPRVHFPHRTFQEFLVAKQIASLTDPAAEIVPHLLDPAWAEVTALTAGVLASQSAEERVSAFLATLAGDPAPPQEWAPRVAAAAVCLKDLEAFDLPPGTLAPIERALAAVLTVLKDATPAAPHPVRVEVANGLGRVRDPRLTEKKRWIVVPAGRFWRGSNEYEDEEPEGWIEVSEFAVQRWPVTVAEFSRFVEDGGYRDRSFWSDGGWSWREGEPSTEPTIEPGSFDEQRGRSGNHPIVEVSWWEAEAYCAWATRLCVPARHGWIIRLPTEAEWEKAARGGETLRDGQTNPDPRRRWAWGSDWTSAKATGYDSSGIEPVGCYIQGNGPYGAWDQSGGVWEWCSDWYGPYAKGEAGLDPSGPDSGTSKAARGGSFRDVDGNLRVSYRSHWWPSIRDDDLGFRCVSAPAR